MPAFSLLLFLFGVARDLLFKIFFGSAAQRADIIFRQIFKFGSRLNPVFGIANARIIFISAQFAHINSHPKALLLALKCRVKCKLHIGEVPPFAVCFSPSGNYPKTRPFFWGAFLLTIS